MYSLALCSLRYQHSLDGLLLFNGGNLDGKAHQSVTMDINMKTDFTLMSKSTDSFRNVLISMQQLV